MVQESKGFTVREFGGLRVLGVKGFLGLSRVQGVRAKGFGVWGEP